MIYLFDKQQNIVGLLKESDLTAGQINFKINTAIELSFSVPINKGFSDDVKYVSIPHPNDNSKHLIFRLMSRTDNVDSIEYTASELAYQELASSAYIEDKRPNNVSASQAMTAALAGSQWSLGTVNISGSITTNFYYITNLEAIQKVVGLMGGEVYFYITITGNKISGRFMDYVFRQGNDTSKVFADGSNLLTVTKKQQSDSIYTAILPRGKGEQVSSGSEGSPDGYGRRIDISGITWSKSSGNPLDKPAGSKILEDPEATAKYGHINGSARLYLTTFDEIEDPNVLIQQAYQTLMSINHPLVEYSATVAKVGNLSLGDTVLIMHSERDLSYKTRVFEVKYDLLNPEMTELSLGDNLSSNSITSQINKLSGSIATNSNQVQWTVTNGGHNNTSFGALEPTNPKKGDVWFKSLPNGNTEEYYFDGTIWVLGAKTDQQWQENRAVAQGDNTTFYGTSTPVGAVVGDVWFKNDNNEPDGKAMYTYSGSVWVKFKGAYDANRLTSGEINGTVLRITNVDTNELVGDIDGKLNNIKNVDTSALVGGLDGTKNPLSNVPAEQLVGTMNKEVVNTISLNAEQITSGKLNSNIVNAIELNAGQITSGQLNSNIVNTIELNAKQITAGELNSNVVNAIKLNASQIATGTLNANIVSAMQLNARQIVAGQIDASIINVVNLNADNLKTGSIDAAKINVMNISADNIVTGTLSANFIKGGQLDFSEINGININVQNLVGDFSTFFQTNWNGKFESTQIDAGGMTVTSPGTITKFDTTGAHFYNNSGRNATYSFGKWSDDSGHATTSTGLYLGATGSNNAFINILGTNGAAALVLAGSEMDFGTNNNVVQGSLNAYVNVNIRERLQFKANRYVGGQPSYIEVNEINRTFNFFTGGGSGTDKDYFYFNQNVISAGTFSSTSALSKKNIKSNYDEDALSEISKTQLVNFEYKNRPGVNQISPIIDDVNEDKEYYIPQTILGQNNQFVDLYSMISMAWKAIQQLDERTK